MAIIENKRDSALNYFDRAENLSEEGEFNQLLAATKAQHADYLRTLGNNAEALIYAQESLSSSTAVQRLNAAPDGAPSSGHDLRSN